MESTLIWTSANANHPSITILFCRDSKSVCEALISSLSNSRISIHNSISSISYSIFTQWIPHHFAIPANDLADKAAKEATTNATNTILPVSFSSSIQVINIMIHLHTNASHKFTIINRLLETPNKSRTEKMTYCLLDYDPVTINLSIIIFIDSTQFKIQFSHHGASMNKTSITGFANVQQVTP